MRYQPVVTQVMSAGPCSRWNAVRLAGHEYGLTAVLVHASVRMREPHNDSAVQPRMRLQCNTQYGGSCVRNAKRSFERGSKYQHVREAGRSRVSRATHPQPLPNPPAPRSTHPRNGRAPGLPALRHATQRQARCPPPLWKERPHWHLSTAVEPQGQERAQASRAWVPGRGGPVWNFKRCVRGFRLCACRSSAVSRAVQVVNG